MEKPDIVSIRSHMKYGNLFGHSISLNCAKVSPIDEPPVFYWIREFTLAPMTASKG